MARKANACHIQFRHQVAHALAPFDGNFGKVFVEEHTLQFRIGFQRYLYHLSLTIGVGSEIDHATAWFALREVILTVAGHTGYIETLDVVGSRLSVAINGVIDRARVILLEHGHMNDFRLLFLCLRTFCFAYKQFVGNAHNFVGAILVEKDDIVDVGTILHIFIFLHTCADETLFTVDVKLLVCFHNLCGSDGVEVLDFGQTWMVLSVLLLDETEPVGGHFHHVGQFLVDLFDFVFDAGNVFLGFVFVELQNARHLNFHQTQDVVLGHLAYHLGIPGGEAFVNPLTGGIHRLGIFELLVLVDAFLDEDLFQ